MDAINYYQIAILVAQCALVSTLILLLFRIRSVMGISLLYAALGLFQYMQVFLSSTIYIEIAKGIVVSPGSSVLFAGSLFAVLLVYIKEDAIEIRKIIYALLIANVIMSVLLYSFGWHIDKSSVYNPLNVSEEFFDFNAWVLLVGTITLFIDSILVILLFELISKFVSSLYVRILLTMALVLTFDTICFSLFSFWNYENLRSILISGLISKNGAAVVYSTIFFFFLKFVDKDVDYSNQPTLKDVFNSLSYRQKFEILKKEKEQVQKEAKNAIQLSKIKYQTLVNVSPVGIFLTNSEGNTYYVNNQWCEIAGIPYSEALGLSWLKAIHPDDKGSIERVWTLATKKKEASYSEYRFIQPNGNIKWVLGQAVPELDEENKIIGYVGTITDITPIKNYERELNLAREKAEEGDRLKTAFLQNISHEIRTPLNAICGFSSFIGSRNLSDDERNNYISIVQSSSDQLLSIVNNILTISALETKQEPVNITNVCINSIVGELIAIFKQQVDCQKVLLSANLQLSDEQSVIFTDKTKITQILSNLVANAIKFTHEGEVEAGYTLKNSELEFYVRDTGIGLKHELHERIFDRFCQADKSIHTYFGGTGLGLSISKGFVELLGGKIWVQSEPNKGATFYFTIPYKPALKDEVSPEDKVCFARGSTVLVAEDEDYNFLYIKELLSLNDLNTIRAMDGKETLLICQSNPEISLILMDIKMPEMDGFEAAQQIKPIRPDLPIIALSAYAMEYEIAKFAKVFDDYITKPINTDELNQKIGKYLKSI